MEGGFGLVYFFGKNSIVDILPTELRQYTYTPQKESVLQCKLRNSKH